MVTQTQKLELILSDIQTNETRQGIIFCAIYDKTNTLRAVRRNGKHMEDYEHTSLRSIQKTAHKLAKTLSKNVFMDSAVIKSRFGPYYAFKGNDSDYATLAVVSRLAPNKKELERYHTYFIHAYNELGPR